MWIIPISAQDSVRSFSAKFSNQSSLIILNANYRVKVNKSQLNSGRGLGLEIGFNIGYFFSQNLLIAPFGGVGFRDAFLNTGFRDSYIADVNSSFNPSGLNRSDSIVATSIISFMNKNGNNFHDNTEYFGLMLKLPYRYCPTLKVYTGSIYQQFKTGLQLRLDSNLTSSDKFDYDYYSIQSKIKWGAEVYLFNGFSKSYQYNYPFEIIKKKDLKFKLSILLLSFYYEQIDNSKTTFKFTNGPENVSVPFEKVMSQAFRAKYKNDYNFGFRLSVGMF